MRLCGLGPRGRARWRAEERASRERAATPALQAAITLQFLREQARMRAVNDAEEAENRKRRAGHAQRMREGADALIKGAQAAPPAQPADDE